MGKYTLKPGNLTPTSGQYQIVAPGGRRGPEITSVKGKPLPPTNSAGSTYILVDATKH